jgi:hypothetical protein
MCDGFGGFLGVFLIRGDLCLSGGWFGIDIPNIKIYLSILWYDYSAFCYTKDFWFCAIAIAV